MVACNDSSKMPNAVDRVIAIIIEIELLAFVVFNRDKNIRAAKTEYSIKWPMTDNNSEEASDGLDDWYKMIDIHARGNNQYRNFFSRYIAIEYRLWPIYRQ